MRKYNKCNTKCSKIFRFKKKIINFFKDSLLLSEAKYKATYRRVAKMLPPR